MPRTIGVLTFHKCINYGSYWQARCLVEGLRSRGFEAELLDHDCACIRRAEVRCALQPKLPERTPRSELGAYARKTRKFIDAIGRLPLSPPFSLHQPQAAKAYDAIVVGSDEVWNFRHPWYRSQPIFFGERLKADRLVSYAASFGNYSCHCGMEERWAKQLKRFDRLSVRDGNSYWLVRGSTGVEPAVVLDPCLQFPAATKARPAPAEAAYALVYGYGFPAWLSSRVRRWADRRGLRLVSVGYSNAWTDEQRIAASPDEFAELMAGAEAVVTNFFHGCVFALLNGKPWAAVASDYRSIKIPDLMRLLGAEHRLADEAMTEQTLAGLLATPVRPEVLSRIGEYRERSRVWLDAALA
jgi:polysaccharide pyruvyl transferase WcaK-like protein